MENQLRIKFKIGMIEFEAEGSTEAVEKQREAFESMLLSKAEAISNTGSLYMPAQTLGISSAATVPVLDAGMHSYENLSVNEFLKSKNFSSQIDIAIGLIYFNEKYKDAADVSSDELKSYFKSAKIQVPKNPSDIINKLVGKSFIMEADEKGRYKLTRNGESFVESYVPKPTKEKKSGTKKTHKKIESAFANITADSLNLQSYPEVKNFKDFKDQMMLALYIVSIEDGRDAFSAFDVQYILTDVLGLPATVNQVQGVFSRNPRWFQNVEDEANKKAIKHRLLNGAKDFAKQLIQANA